MSVYNGEKYLIEAIDSILSQTYTDFEFLIIDDGSTDRTSEILFSYDDPRIRIVTNKENIGLTKSLNKGLALARGEYIARMDADDISHPERFKKQIIFLDNDPYCGIVGTSIKTIDFEGKIINTHKLLFNPSYPDFLKGNQLIHGSIMTRKVILDQFSGYNEIFKKTQDYALWLQIAKKFNIYNLHEYLYYLRLHDKSISFENTESIMYHILAIRIAESSIDDALLKRIDSNGITEIMDILTKKEKIFYHNLMAGRYIHLNDSHAAINEFKKIFLYEPWNFVNLINIFRIIFGINAFKISNCIYLSLKNSFNLILIY